jgi:hypothetical protein
MSVINNNLLLGSDGYNISRSVRLRSSASGSFTRTLTTPTDGKKWTVSAWVKKGSTATAGLQANNGTAASWLSLGDNGITLTRGTVGVSIAWNAVTAAIYRDPSAWYHGVWSYDSTQATAANRIKFYVNGAQVTSSGSYPSLNEVTEINSAYLHTLMNGNAIGASDGYLTEVNFIDGQALTPSSFGETDAVTGVWKPKKYGGTYGTNGFYLNFSDNSAATAAAIGKDSSGNGNNWTPNNISVTAGATYDSMLDTPTPYADGGNGRGNYAVLNPLLGGVNNAIMSNGNITSVLTATTQINCHASFPIPQTGKWYCEVQVVNASALGLSLIHI